MPVAQDALSVALIAEVFPLEPGPQAAAATTQPLVQVLAQARRQGAELAVLPELPLNHWAPASSEPRDDDAEPPAGPRHQTLAQAARSAGIALVGGAIVRDPASGQRFNTALVFDARGRLINSYRKTHIPDEPGFRESAHYLPGDDVPEPFHLDPPAPNHSTPQASARPWRLGVQICSDANRPALALALPAMGAEVILVPRATTADLYESCWKPVLRAIAIASGTYVLTVNRPRAERNVALGGPSLAVAPDGRVVLESTERVALVELSRAAVLAARRAYPGYLALRSRLYARAWSRAADTHITSARSANPNRS